MTIDEFNEARNAIAEAHQAALTSKTASAVADLYMAASINGLVLTPVDFQKEVPAPICGFMVIREAGTGKAITLLVFPEDQLAK